MKIDLSIYKGSQKLQSVSAILEDGQEYQVGRDADWLKISSKSVDILHFVFYKDQNNVMVKNYSQERGTLVNDKIVVEPCEITLGDVIKFGKYHLRIRNIEYDSYIELKRPTNALVKEEEGMNTKTREDGEDDDDWDGEEEDGDDVFEGEKSSVQTKDPRELRAVVLALKNGPQGYARSFLNLSPQLSFRLILILSALTSILAAISHRTFNLADFLLTSILGVLTPIIISLLTEKYGDRFNIDYGFDEVLSLFAQLYLPYALIMLIGGLNPVLMATCAVLFYLFAYLTVIEKIPLDGLRKLALWAVVLVYFDLLKWVLPKSTSSPGVTANRVMTALLFPDGPDRGRKNDKKKQKSIPLQALVPQLSKEHHCYPSFEQIRYSILQSKVSLEEALKDFQKNIDLVEDLSTGFNSKKAYFIDRHYKKEDALEAYQLYQCQKLFIQYHQDK